MRLIDADELIRMIRGEKIASATTKVMMLDAVEESPTVDAVPVVRCRGCRHKKLDGPSSCKSIVNEFYCDEKLEWRYQYEGEPDILDWFCADGEAKPNAS